MFMVAGAVKAERWEAHEWGTFTTFQNSAGGRVPWYPAQENRAAELPEFVGFNVQGVGKGFGFNYVARMETPVIYFYTDKPRAVDVRANYRGGAVTEWYPFGRAETTNGVAAPFVYPGAQQVVDRVAVWENLFVLPFGHESLSEVKPPVADSDRGNHYYEAREVPEAALVLDNNRETAQAERFVFYRGAGPMDGRVVASLEKGGKFTVTNHHRGEAMTHTWAVRVENGTMAWGQMPVFPKAGEKPMTAEMLLDGSGNVEFEKSVPAIENSFVEALTESGLTSSEAKAMVNTWESSWFTEAGTRVFTIMPVSVVEEMLPLQIDPAPRKLGRVFVHSMEILSPETESLLIAALDESEVSQETARRVAAMELGRFESAAFEMSGRSRNARFEQETRDRMGAVISASRNAAETKAVALSD